MAIETISRIQHRRGLKADLPPSLNEGELGFCLDTRELFIGNSPTFGGNTQVLTTGNTVVQNIVYQYLSSTSVSAQTGGTGNPPVTRPLQDQLDDYWVNVRAYGAVGNGIADDTTAINNALYDIYNKTLSSTENNLQARKALWFPSGVYRITQPLIVGPLSRLVGENSQTVVIELDNASATPSVLRLSDSNGQTGSAMGQNGAALPNNVLIQDLTLSTTGSQDIVWLENCTDIGFQRCIFNGSTVYTTLTTQKAVYITNLTGSAFNNWFTGCTFNNVEIGLHSTDAISNTTIDRCKFTNMFRGIELLATTGGGPQFTRVGSSIFDTVFDSGIYCTSTNPGIISFGNSFINCGKGTVPNVGAIYWSLGTKDCASVADIFDLAPFVTGSIASGGSGANFILDPQQNNINTSIVTPTTNVLATDTTSAATYTMSDTNNVLIVLSPPCTVTLYNGINLQKGQTVTIKDGAGTSYTSNITISGNGNLIDGQSSYILNVNYGSVSLVFDGTEWRII